MTSNDLSIAKSLGQQDKLALIEEMQILPDFRAPDNIRFGLVPLYTSFTNVHTAVSHLQTIVTDKRYEKYAAARGLVT